MTINVASHLIIDIIIKAPGHIPPRSANRNEWFMKDLDFSMARPVHGGLLSNQ